MADSNKFDIKTITIFVLGVILVLVIIFGNVFNKPDIDSYTNEISKLNQENKQLLHQNDSINFVNKKLDVEIAAIDKQVEENKKKLASTQLELNKLKKERNEISTYVSHLSGNDVADSFTKYLEQRDKSKANH